MCVLALYWSRTASWCLAEGYRLKISAVVQARVARKGLYFLGSIT